MLPPSLALLALCFSTTASAAASAWNGHTTPQSTAPVKFSPLFVPSGTQATDSSSPHITYHGTWSSLSSQNYFNHSLHRTTSKHASATFHFTGTGVEWYGNTGKRYGMAAVFLDAKLAATSNALSDKDQQQQLLFFAYNLTSGPHSIKIVNTAFRTLDIDAFVVTNTAPAHHLSSSPAPSVLSSPSRFQAVKVDSKAPPVWTLQQKGSTGVSAMQLAIISPSHAIIIDKVEHNPLTIDGHPAWGALYNLNTHALKPLNIKSNSFCAGGTFLSNGTLINVGGNPVVSDHTSAADFGDVDGLQAIRMFHPCETDSVVDCDIYENHARIRMATPRWYNTVLRISDGSAMIIGGSKKGGWMNNATTNNPTLEYYPPKNIHGSNGLPIHLPFLEDTLNSNLFPIAFSLPGNKIFVAANRDAMIYDWQANSEKRLPPLPNGVRVTYPMTGTGVLLPLSTANNYEPEVLLCGGSTLDDTTPGYEISSQAPASAQCVRMVLTDAGIAQGWAVEQMPQARIMPDAVLLPTGQVLLVNGGATGISGYGNVRGQVGFSNADNPVQTPVLYTPDAPSGQRFSQDGMPESAIPRLYHSTATLTPRGDVMIAGSNPNLDRSETRYGTEYRVEWLGPPYMAGARPVVSSVPKRIGFGQVVTMKLALPAGAPPASDVKVACMDLGYVTHAVHANARLVYLTGAFDAGAGSLRVTGPPDGGVYPPGPAWLYVVVNGVPSEGTWIMVGDGQGPPVDDGALANMLKQTAADQYEDAKDGETGDGSE